MTKIKADWVVRENPQLPSTIVMNLRKTNTNAVEHEILDFSYLIFIFIEVQRMSFTVCFALRVSQLNSQ